MLQTAKTMKRPKVVRRRFTSKSLAKTKEKIMNAILGMHSNYFEASLKGQADFLLSRIITTHGKAKT